MTLILLMRVCCCKIINTIIASIRLEIGTTGISMIAACHDAEIASIIE